MNKPLPPPILLSVGVGMHACISPLFLCHHHPQLLSVGVGMHACISPLFLCHHHPQLLSVGVGIQACISPLFLCHRHPQLLSVGFGMQACISPLFLCHHYPQLLSVRVGMQVSAPSSYQYTRWTSDTTLWRLQANCGGAKEFNLIATKVLLFYECQLRLIKVLHS